MYLNTLSETSELRHMHLSLCIYVYVYLHMYFKRYVIKPGAKYIPEVHVVVRLTWPVDKRELGLGLAVLRDRRRGGVAKNRAHRLVPGEGG